MFETIIVGIDGHDGGRDALRLARRLGDASSRIVAVSVAIVPREREDVSPFLTELDAGLDREAVAALSVAEGLHLAARQHAADLIVVGSSRRGVLGRIIAGDDAAATIRDAPCVVAIAPCGYADMESSLDLVGVGYDAGQESEAALALARRLAGQQGARLRAMQVVHSAIFPSTAEMVAADVADARAHLHRLGGLEAKVTVGLPIDGLREFSAEVDLLVLGSRNRGLAAQVVLGSTSAELARYAHAPLLVVPRTAIPADEAGSRRTAGTSAASV